MSLPAIPSGFSGDFKSVSQLSASIKRPIEPVGQYFLAHATRTLRGHTWSEFEKIEAEKNVTVVDESNGDEEFNEDQSAELLATDPRHWKECDLYAVLGLTKYRHKATEDQIRRAHRVQVLKHHPDKKSASGGLDQDDFFKVIQKAFETILDPVKRRQFDSVDTNADVPPPNVKSTYDFYEAWGPFFESESRFSNRQPVPSLGDSNSTKEEVESFYKFWHNFDSWKTFEFLDEDVPDDTANRDHKRYIEKKNNNARKKRKTEDTKRLADLVKRANAEDPRIKKFKEDEKAEKAKKKWEREAGARKAAEEAKAKEEAEAKAKKEAELAAQQSKESGKKAKEAAKNAKKKNKRTVRSAVKDNAYFGDESKTTAIDADIETLIDAFDDVTLGDVAAKLTGADSATAKQVLTTIASELKSSGKISSLKYF
ncbi:hypothetical protein CANARDRAFT_173303 [[Candida] arabinofermentans NRRL YB-2248]|uniref:J domain-containing protein n=1 Tax=[Candida] arabinofermentans NRRL YB-2248 TaxID=983967 RepID=A0A1E4SZ98_9ASCO|nr:hypothetical protein CANARDRAFT_173303 [[Candida] arabinofermentans NRRL YB-2248]